MAETSREQAGVLRAWTAYAGSAIAVTLVFAVGARMVAGEDAAAAVRVSAALACGLQLIAFAGLVWFRNHAQLFLAGWLLGMALRFGALGGVAWWLGRSAAFPRVPALISLVLVMFLLLLMEPIFLRWDLRKR